MKDVSLQESGLIVRLAAVEDLRDAIIDFERYFTETLDDSAATLTKLETLLNRMTWPAGVLGIGGSIPGQDGFYEGILTSLLILNEAVTLTLYDEDGQTHDITFHPRVKGAGWLEVRGVFERAEARAIVAQFCDSWQSYLKEAPGALQIFGDTKLHCVNREQVAAALCATVADVDEWESKGCFESISGEGESKLYDPLDIAYYAQLSVKSSQRASRRQPTESGTGPRKTRRAARISDR